MNKGDVNKCLYKIQSGTVVVENRISEKEVQVKKKKKKKNLIFFYQYFFQVIATLPTGAFFGEVSLLNPEGKVFFYFFILFLFYFYFIFILFLFYFHFIFILFLFLFYFYFYFIFILISFFIYSFIFILKTIAAVVAGNEGAVIQIIPNNEIFSLFEKEPQLFKKFFYTTGLKMAERFRKNNFEIEKSKEEEKIQSTINTLLSQEKKKESLSFTTKYSLPETENLLKSYK